MALSSSNAPVAIVLGGTAPHRQLITKLKDRGYRTVLVDYLPNPPAKTLADCHEQESTLDAEAVKRIAQRHQAALVISACLDQPLPIMAQVSKDLNLPCYLSPEQSKRVTNKVLMKSVFEKAGIPTSRWITTSRNQIENAKQLNFPVITKPISGTGSLGIFVSETFEELKNNLVAVGRFGADDRLLIEEFKSGREVSVDCLVAEGKSHVLAIRDRHKIWLGDESMYQCYATVTPADVCNEVQTRIKAISQEIAIAFGLVDSPLLIQAIVGHDSSIWVLEIAARVGGGMGGSRTVFKKTGVDLVGMTLDCALGQVLRFAPNADCFHYASGSIYGAGGVISKIDGFDQLVELGIFEEYILYRCCGYALPVDVSSRNRVAAYMIKARSLRDLRYKMSQAFEIICLEDGMGNSLLRRDIGLHPTE